MTICWKGAPQLSRGELPHLGQRHRTTLFRPEADELSWSGPSTNDVGSAGQRSSEKAPCGQPGHPAFSKSSCRGIFGSESREHYASGGEGVQERRPLSGPPYTCSKHNKPTAKAQSHFSASPPSALSLSQSCQNPTREPDPEKRRLTLAGELSGKFLLLVMAKKKKEKKKKIMLLKITSSLRPAKREMGQDSRRSPEASFRVGTTSSGNACLYSIIHSS